MSLANDYRPIDLDQIVGNEQAVATLESIFRRKPELLPHCVLFVGPKGCGKTTLARITARRLAVGDVVEQNSASYRGIDSAREIIQQARLRPLRGDRRAWLLDECHKLTADAQEAMLKLFEEPPAHVFFLLCTTDPQKLKKTVVDRCTVIRVEALNRRQIETLITSVLTKEKVDVDQKVIDAVVNSCDGSARQALTTLDAVIDMAPADALRVASQREADEAEGIELCRALMKPGCRWTDVQDVLAKMGTDYDVENVRLGILGYCQRVMLDAKNKADACGRAWLIMDAFREPFDRNGRPGVTWAAYMVAQAK